MPEPKLREEFRNELRARLMQEAVTALAPRPRVTAWSALLRPALGVGLAGFLLVAAAGTTAARSVPGDVAFPLKRAFEDLQVTLTFDDVRRVELLALIADRRLAELQLVADHSDGTRAPTASEEFADAVIRFRAEVDAVQEAAPEERSALVQDVLESAREKHEAVLEELRPRIENEKAQQAIERAKVEEDKDSKKDKDKRGPNAKTPRPTRTATPRPTPRATVFVPSRPTAKPGETQSIPSTPRADNRGSGDRDDDDRDRD
jgi:hypothetical protein